MNHKKMEHNRGYLTACRSLGVTPDLDGVAYAKTYENGRADLKEVDA